MHTQPAVAVANSACFWLASRRPQRHHLPRGLTRRLSSLCYLLAAAFLEVGQSFGVVVVVVAAEEAGSFDAVLEELWKEAGWAEEPWKPGAVQEGQ